MLEQYLMSYQLEFLNDLHLSEHFLYCYVQARRLGISEVLSIFIVEKLISEEKVLFITTGEDCLKDFENNLISWFDRYNYPKNFLNFKGCDRIPTIEDILEFNPSVIVIDNCAYFKCFDNFCRELSNFIKYEQNIKNHLMKLIMVSSLNEDDPTFEILASVFKENQESCYYKELNFKEAVKLGLYKKICEVNKVEWTLENEKQWIEEIYVAFGESSRYLLDLQGTLYL